MNEIMQNGHNGQMTQQLAAQMQPLAAQLGKLSLGQLIDTIVQLFAARQPLPAAPVATLHLQTDVANLFLFAEALAKQRATPTYVSVESVWTDDTRP